MSPTRTKCSGCGKRISRSEPDLVLREHGRTKSRVYHRGCVSSALRLVNASGTPGVWHLTDRFIDGALN